MLEMDLRENLKLDLRFWELFGYLKKKKNFLIFFLFILKLRFKIVNLSDLVISYITNLCQDTNQDKNH